MLASRQKRRTNCQQSYISVDVVEKSVVDYYAALSFSKSFLSRLAEDVLEQIGVERSLNAKN
ncbi:MAG TPA: hypothetical protein VIB78_00985 [Acidimicrobiia bacterium]|jgi:hypothetical protein